MSVEVVEQARSFAQNEEIIERGMATFVEVGEALRDIRDSRQYLHTHETFEAYCKERWDLSKPYATQLIAAHDTVAIATTAELPAPRTESVARELAPLREDPDVLCDVWAKTIELHGEKPTAAQARQVVRQLHRPEPESKPEKAKCPTCGHLVNPDDFKRGV